MNHHYEDIRSRIPEPPRWFDEHAVPRWSDFSPRETADIYARECCLVLIECQGCGHEFKVAFAWSSWDVILGRHPKPLSETVKDLHYGDPPNIGCCGAGPTMNSIPRRVLEFWQAKPIPTGTPMSVETFLDGGGWTRRPDLEVEIECDWAAEP